MKEEQENTRAAPPHSPSWPRGRPIAVDSQTLMYAALVVRASAKDPLASESHRSVCEEILAVIDPLFAQGNADASPPPDSVSESLREARRLLGEVGAMLAGTYEQRDLDALESHIAAFLGERET